MIETVCLCISGWICEDHPDQPYGHEGCGAAGELCTNPECDKMQILFLNLFATATQGNDLAVLTHSFDRSSTALLRSRPK